MDLPRLSKNVRRVTILNHDAATGAPMAVTVFKRGRKKKKSSRLLSPAEKVVRMYADVSDTATSTDAAYPTISSTHCESMSEPFTRDLGL